jgi:glycosyltransferase involved in cell wall biosynthesis
VDAAGPAAGTAALLAVRRAPPLSKRYGRFPFIVVLLSRDPHALYSPMGSFDPEMRRDAPVLLATNTYGLLDGEVNGVAYTCRNFVRLFADAGMRVDVLTYGRPERIEVVDDRLRLLVHDPVNGFNIDPALRIDPFFATGAIAAEAAATTYSLVHTTTPDPLGWHAAGIAKKQNIPLVADFHTMVEQYARIRYGAYLRIAGIAAEHFLRALLDWYYGQADLILAPSDAVRTLLEARFDIPVATVTRGVDHDVFSPRHRTRPHDDAARAVRRPRGGRERTRQARRAFPREPRGLAHGRRRRALARRHAQGTSQRALHR